MASALDLGCLFLAESHLAAIRSMGRFAEEEIILPEDGGPFGGEPFSRDAQPVFGLFFDEVDTGRWPRIAGLGPTQTGKTMGLFVIPILHALFERVETVVCGIPDMRMAQDKYSRDLLPVIKASPSLSQHLPRSGEGSAGGKVHSQVTFTNGSTLRFMSAGQRDTGRAGFTARVLAITEADAMGRVRESAIEANPVAQLEGRLRATRLKDRLTYLEGTVSVPTGLIWVEYQAGTASRVMIPCPYCKAHVSPEREHFRGHEEAESEWEAYDSAHWVCPACEKPWTEKQRHEANHRAVLVHKGQSVTSRGKIEGPLPKTFTFGFRYSAVNNLFLDAGDLAVDLFRARISPNADDEERRVCQQVFAVPYEPPDVDLSPLDAADVVQRIEGPKRGILPHGTVAVTVGTDTHKRRLDWVALAWQSDGSARVVEYGEQPVDWQTLGTHDGLIAAFRSLVPLFRWQREDGGTMQASAVWIDAHWHEHTQAVIDFCREMAKKDGCKRGKERFRPCWGEGESIHMAGRYTHPTKTDRLIRAIGREYYLKWEPEPQRRMMMVHVNADHWKTEVRDRMARPIDQPGAMSLYTAPQGEHRAYIEQLLAERPEQRWNEKRGDYVVWVRIRRRNHKLDATYLATTAGHFVEAQAIRARAKKESAGWWANRKHGRRA